jgi:membrane-associated phospholipid phosphatase
LGLCLLFIVLAKVPATWQVIFEWDKAGAYFFNHWLGHSKTLDIAIAYFNSRNGDLAVFVCLGLFFLIHSLIPLERKSVCQKLAFWGWVGVIFIFTQILQSQCENIMDRKSAGSELAKNWFNLKEVYGIKTRVGSGASFPSGHVVSTLFFTLMAYRRGYRVGAVLLFCLLIVLSVTRMMSGAHWPTDIVGSIPIAMLWASLAYETPIVNFNRWLEMFLNGMAHVFEHRKDHPFTARIAAAWKVFLTGEKAE